MTQKHPAQPTPSPAVGGAGGGAVARPQHAQALQTLGVDPAVAARAAGLGIDWGDLLSKLLPVILDVVAQAASHGAGGAAGHGTPHAQSTP